jgi:hypothetical protein
MVDGPLQRSLAKHPPVDGRSPVADLHLVNGFPARVLAGEPLKARDFLGLLRPILFGAAQQKGPEGVAGFRRTFRSDSDRARSCPPPKFLMVGGRKIRCRAGGFSGGPCRTALKGVSVAVLLARAVRAPETTGNHLVERHLVGRFLGSIGLGRTVRRSWRGSQPDLVWAPGFLRGGLVSAGGPNRRSLLCC